MRNTILDSILASGNLNYESRVLTTDITWTSDNTSKTEPLDIPAIIENQILTNYPSDEWDANPNKYTLWTNCSALVESYHINDDTGFAILQASLTVPSTWNDITVERMFRDMRVIAIQERYFNDTHDTGWVTQCIGVSEGNSQTWETDHGYVINIKGLLKLANLDFLEKRIYEADKIQIGDEANHVTLAYLGETTEAFEYGFTLNKTADTAVWSNWCDKPAPQLWITVAGQEYPIVLAGNAVNIVFGEGVVRLNKQYCVDSPGTPVDYTKGLGLELGVHPTITGTIYRYVVPEGRTEERTRGLDLPADVKEGITTRALAEAESYEVAVYASDVCDGVDCSQFRGAFLRLKLSDSPYTEYTVSDMRMFTDIIGLKTYLLYSLTDTTASIPVGSRIDIANANELTYIAKDLLLNCGYHTNEIKAGYLDYISTPQIGTPPAGVNITLPPLVYKLQDEKTALQALTDLWSEGSTTPNWMLFQGRNGGIGIKNVYQKTEADPHTIPVNHVLPGLTIEHSDNDVATRVVARGKVRVVKDLSKEPGTTIGSSTLAIPDGATTVTVTSSLNDVIASYVPSTLDYKKLLLKGYRFEQTGYGSPPPDSTLYNTGVNTYNTGFKGKTIGIITLDSPQNINQIELQTPSAVSSQKIWTERTLYSIPQNLAVDYYDEIYKRWLPLISFIQCENVIGSQQQFSAEDFDTRDSVYTSKLRLRCLQPAIQINKLGYALEYKVYYHYFIWLYRIKIFSSPEIQAEAELGVTEGFTSDGWKAIRNRMRRRTYFMEEAAVWADTPEMVQDLAILWLQEKVKNLATFTLKVIRPDIEKWDTIKFVDPVGVTQTALVISVDHTDALETTIQCIDYSGSYFGV
jgi:hypothetical protein